MSISILYHTQGISGYTYTRTTYLNGALFFDISPKQKLIRCPICHSKHIQLRGTVERYFMLLPVGTKQQFARVEIPRVFCHSCKKLRQIDIRFAEENRRYSKAFERYVLELCLLMTIEAVAEHLGIDWHTVKEIHKRQLSKKYSTPKLKNLRHIAIDEISMGKNHKYITLVLDQDSGAVVFIGEGKGWDALDPFWIKIRRYRGSLESVSIDMSPAYTKAVREHLPNVPLVYDHFHVIKLYNDRLSKFRRWLYEHSSKGERQYLKGSRWLLLKNRENLDADQSRRLEELLRVNEPLSIAYMLKEQLQEIWKKADMESAGRAFDDWVATAESSSIAMLQSFAKTLERHREGILNYYRVRVTTAKLEGTNAKIRVMQRQGYGYRDAEYLRLKILSLHENKNAPEMQVK